MLVVLGDLDRSAGVRGPTGEAAFDPAARGGSPNGHGALASGGPEEVQLKTAVAEPQPLPLAEPLAEAAAEESPQ